MRFFESYYPLRTRYLYNTLIYGLLSHVAERMDGKQSYEDLMNEKIFHPLGMTNTTFTHTADLDGEDIAQAYLPDNGSYREIPPEMRK